MKPLSRWLAVGSLLLGCLTACMAAGPKPVPVQRCPDVDTPADFDPSSPQSMERAVQGGPRILYGLGAQRHEVLQRMLAEGENPNVCVLSFSVLALAVESGDLQDVRILLDGGADPDRPATSDGETPLLAGLSAGRFDAAALLLKRGANPVATTDSGMTGLHLLAQTPPHSPGSAAQLELSAELIRRGVSVNAQTRAWRDTALMFASLNGNKPLVEQLLRNHADPSLINKRGETALSFAQKKGFADIVQLLENARETSR